MIKLFRNKIINTNFIIKNNNSFNNNNFSNLNKFNNIRLFCNTTNTNIEINSLKQSYNELLKLDLKQIEKEGLPSKFLKIQNDILKCNENELNIQTRMISSFYLWKSLCFSNLTPHTIKKEELDKLWKLININNKEIQNKNEYLSILNHRIGMSFTSRYLITNLYDDIKSVVNEVKSLENSSNDSNDKSISSLLPLINIAFESSSHLNMWKEMKYLGDKLRNEELNNQLVIFENKRNTAFNIDYIFDYYSIYNILNLSNTNSSSSSSTSLLPLIIDINKESEKLKDTNKFINFRVYDVESFGFKNLTMKNENMSNETKEKAQLEFNDNLNQMKNQKIDRNGYFTTELPYPPFISIFGSSFKFDICFDTNSQMTHSGIINDDFTKVQLYGTYDEFDKTKVESEYNLSIDEPLEQDIEKSFIQLKGTHRKIETRSNGEKSIYDMNVVINLQRRKLLYEQQQK